MNISKAIGLALILIAALIALGAPIFNPTLTSQQLVVTFWPRYIAAIALLFLGLLFLDED